MTTTLTTNEVLVDLFMERAVDLLRLEAGTRDKVLVFLHEMEGEIVGKIAKIDPTAVDGMARQRARLAKLLDEVRRTIKATYRDVSTLMTREVREVADNEASWTGGAMNEAIGATFADSGITREFLTGIVKDAAFLGGSAKDWWGRQAQGVSGKFNDEMRRGVALGESNADLISRVRGKAGHPGIMDVTRNSAERLVRASVQSAANTAREHMYEKNDDLIASLQWHATLDTRTSKWCIVRDGHHYSNTPDHTPKDKGPAWLEGPGKLHWGCRSTSIPILKSWRDLGIDEDEVPPTTRASMDGQVPAQQSFETWLKKQSAARQDTVLGADVAALWRDGKLTFRDLLDQSGRPLTTEQLRAKAARK